jgi:hypothetical protein
MKGCSIEVCAMVEAALDAMNPPALKSPPTKIVGWEIK